MSWVRIPHRAALLFSLQKRAVLGVVDLFVLPFPFYLVVYIRAATKIIASNRGEIFNKGLNSASYGKRGPTIHDAVPWKCDVGEVGTHCHLRTRLAAVRRYNRSEFED